MPVLEEAVQGTLLKNYVMFIQTPHAFVFRFSFFVFRFSFFQVYRLCCTVFEEKSVYCVIVEFTVTHYGSSVGAS